MPQSAPSNLRALIRPTILPLFVAWVGLLALSGCGSGSSTFGISGTITGATGVTVQLTGSANRSTTTDGKGDYAFDSIANGSYILTPSVGGYRFSPASIAVTVNGGNVTGQSFTGTAATYSISGTVSGSVADGVLITLSGTTGGTATTAGGGLYSFSGLADGSYTLTPSKAGYSFSPPSIAVTVNAANSAGQNFVSTSTTACSADNWSSVSSGTTAVLSSVWGSGASDVWAVGAPGTILHWNGGAWSSVSSGTTAVLSSVWGSGASDVWAVGGSGTILHWNGSAWSIVSSGTTTFLYSVWGSEAGDVWAVGGSGTILHWNGSAWSSVSSATTTFLYSVWGSGASDVWAVGESGTILHWNGSAWSSVSSGTTGWLYGVWGTGAGDAWVVGDGGNGWDYSLGLILHWNGSAWSSISSGTTNALSSVWGSGAGSVWAVGDGGTILHWEGSAWSCVSSGTTNLLDSVWGSGASDVWAVGGTGTILERRLPTPPPTPPVPQHTLALRLYESAALHAGLASSPHVWLAYDDQVPGSGPCVLGGSFQVSLDGAQAPAVLPTGSHAFAAGFDQCRIDPWGGVWLNGTASSAYTATDLNDLTAQVSANSMRVNLVGYYSDLYDVTADGSGTWTRLRAGTLWTTNWAETTTYRPSIGSTLTNNETTNVATFGGGVYSSSFSYGPAPGYALLYHDVFDSLAIAIGGTSYTLSGSIDSVIWAGRDGLPNSYTGEVRVTSNGTLVARIFGDGSGALRTEVLTPLAPF
jgi:hypothetical protein